MTVPYHRLFRVHPRWRWWRPLLALAVFAGFYLVSQVVIGVAYFVPAAASGGVEGLEHLQDQLSGSALDPTDPLVLSLTLVSLIVLLPSIMVAVRIAGLGPIGQLSSVALRIRWRWMARCLLPLLVLAVVMVGIQTLGMYVVDGSGVHWNHEAIGQSTVSMGTLVVTLVLVVVAVPFQAAAEEYIFRGFLMQTVGGWLRSPIVPIAVSTVVFAVLHVPNGYNIWGILDVGTFGLVAALIVWRTGGLEATILLHALNNVTIFVIQAPGWSRVDLNGSDGSVGGWLLTLVTSLVYWALVELAAWRSGLVRRWPGAEAPRFVGAHPVWARGFSARPGRPGGPDWVGTPARDDDSGRVL